MSTRLIEKAGGNEDLKGGSTIVPLANSVVILAVALALAMAGTGCQTSASKFSDLQLENLPNVGNVTNVQNVSKSDAIVLHEGDSVRVSFPGAPNLNTVAPIRRDGRITLQLVGEVKASGLTPNQLEKELIRLYGPQLQTKEVTVAVETSAFPVYVTGAVLRPGKVLSDRPLTALEAVMEAGGFDYTKANLKAVTVIRRENGKTEHHKVNLKRVLQGNDTEQFNLKPSDIVYVPERFTWF